MSRISSSQEIAVPLEDRLIYALDGMTREEATASVRRLCDVIEIYKIGPSLIYQGGLDVAVQLAKAGGDKRVRIFLDMKTWDIPETVLNAINTIEKLAGEAVVFATIHTEGSGAIGKIAAAKRTRPFKLFAVTHLTSLDETDLRMRGITLPENEYVLRMARLARDAGCDGVICSGYEVGMIKREFGSDFLAITPGIRPAWARVAGDDQKRVVTPAEAIRNGADYIVVGRPIRTAADPVQAAWAIRKEIEAALREAGGSPSTGSDPRMMAAG